ncbi:hypothetical protein KC322_g19189, partial [Hortaea werneckii]
MDELFDVFDEKAAKPSEGGKKEKKSKKRSASGDFKNQAQKANGDANMEDAPQENGRTPANGEAQGDETQHNQKRQRKDDEPEPIVTDMF